MTPYKGKWPFRLGLLLPLLFLSAYLVEVPVPLPAFLSPERTYLLIQDTGTPESTIDARLPRNNVFLVLADRVRPLTRGEGRQDAAARMDTLPARASIETALRDADLSPPRFGRIRLICGSVPSASEILAVEAFQRRSGRSVSIVVPDDKSPLLRALSYRRVPGDASLSVALLPGPGILAYQTVALSQGSAALGSWSTRKLPAAGIPAVAAESQGPLTLTLAGPSGTESRDILVASSGEGSPNVLVVSEKGDRRCFLDALYETRRLRPEELKTADLAAYPLVAFDGVALRDIPPEVSRILRDLVDRKAVSLLFAVDSGNFGRAGDNPDLEPLLPVDLLPRSLKRLPDLAVLLLLDVSGSMFGDKLSLAKATGLELLKALKPTDRVGLLLFSEGRRWLHRFELNASIEATRDIPNLAAGGGTDLAGALREGLALLEKQDDRDLHAVIVTDGVTKSADFRPLEDSARRAGVSLSTIAVGKDADFALLERLSRNTGGRAYRAEGFDQIPALLFEDRTSVSRNAFSRETQAILNLNGDPVATVDGMALLTPRSPSSVLLANELGDPLLASREYRNRAVVVFASDLYGGYTEQFFQSPRAAAALKSRLDALLSEERVSASITEHGGGVELVLQSAWLVSPSVRAVSADNRLAWEGPLHPTAPGVFGASLPLTTRGRYTAVLSDRGAVFSRLPLAMNGGFRGVPASAQELARDYRSAPFVLFKSKAFWLLAFFLSSLAMTLLLRIDHRRRPAPGSPGQGPGGGSGQKGAIS